MTERDYDHDVADVVRALRDYAENAESVAAEKDSEYERGYTRGYYRALLMARTIAKNPDHLD